MKQIRLYRDLIRWHKPIGSWLLLGPMLAALGDTYYQTGTLSLGIWFIFIMGAFVMRSLGCVINDLFDHQIDAQVVRTQNRPLAARHLSIKTGIICAAILAMLAISLLIVLPPACFFWAVLAAFLTVLYPTTKRWFIWPQLCLGLAYGMSIPMVYAAVMTQIPPYAWNLYVGTVLWMMVTDTYYARQDMKEDQQLGLYSTALFFGERYPLILALLQGAMLFSWSVFWWSAGYSIQVVAILWVVMSLDIVYQQFVIRQAMPAWQACFEQNRWTALAMALWPWLALML